MRTKSSSVKTPNTRRIGRFGGFRLIVAAIVCALALARVAAAQEMAPNEAVAKQSTDAVVAAGSVFNVRSFGATANNGVISSRTTTGSRTVAVAGTAGLAPGQPVVLIHAGPPTSLGAPSGFSATAITYDQDMVVDKPGCTVSPSFNPNCYTPWTFQVQAVDALGGISPVTQRAVVTNGPQQPSPTDRIKLVWDSTAAATGYMVYACPGAGCTPALAAVLPNTWFTDADASPCNGCSQPSKMVYWYMGNIVPNKSARPRDFGVDQALGTRLSPAGANQNLYTTITSILSGNSVGVADGAGTSGNVQMNHDDSPAFQAAINKAKAAGQGASVFIPAGVYPIGRPLDFEPSYGMHVFGVAAAQSVLAWRGAPGGTMLDLNQTRDSIFENFGVNNAPGVTTPGVAVDIDKYDSGRGMKQIATHDTLADLIIGSSGIAVRLGNRSIGNCEMMQFRNVDISPYYAGWVGYYIASRASTVDEEITAGSIGPRPIGILLDEAGSVDSYAVNMNNNQIDWYIIHTAYFSHLIEKATDSEHAAEHLYVPGTANLPLTIDISDSRFYDYVTTIAANGYYMINNSSRGMELSGNDVCGEYTVPCRIFVTSGPNAPAELLSVNNRYGTLHPFATAAGGKLAVVSVLDHGCNDAAGPGKLCQSQLLSSNVNPAVAQLLLSQTPK